MQMSIECNPFSPIDNTDLDWVRMSFQNEGEKSESALAIFMMQLFEHLEHCRLKDPPIADYLSNILKESAYRLMPLSVKFLFNEARRRGIELPAETTYAFKDGQIHVDAKKPGDQTE